jgi:hypothetical protein
MTPAALKAAVSGDMENFVAAMTPGGIEAQEKRGQIEQSFAETLPVDMGTHRRDFEALGFVFGKSDELFIEAKFPKGWRKKPTEHSMWSEIVDDQGRKRGMIFYKAAFYDKRAHARLETRFQVTDDYAAKNRTVSVADACGKVDKKITGLKAPNWDGDRDTAKCLDDKIEAARNELKAWLEKTYPEWQSPIAHWND